ncbi:MAG: tRNA preQ1(34) S-adenosylmethionine ribosyltransferase-isomerase QueA [Deltaproteobacteria bacterium]|jgi:S-adenosylmethionine:tRNA ribosyltransferase-isomerase|nr:tRNA preQ1(34) S-adenosylmethionine ribosyltransferase-isomerase QueA [Deltaproteobacteria bacterium]
MSSSNNGRGGHDDRPPISLDDYRYELPRGLVAQEPAAERGGSRLMVVRKIAAEIVSTVFGRLEDHLPEGALIVLNDAMVTPARLIGTREDGGRAELLILDPPLDSEPGEVDRWCLARPGRRLARGTKLRFEGGPGETVLRAVVVDAEPGGPKKLVRFSFPKRPLAVLDELGRPPLPPYIKRPADKNDLERYQTVYASSPGAVAAPTAGLHFTGERLNALEKTRPLAKVTLRVGAGTFAPLTETQLREKKLHEEYVEIPEKTADAVIRAKKENRPVLAVGTTTARALEWASQGGQIEPKSGLCSLFITPGHRFDAVDCLLTNFHLPGSSLMLLVGALLGRDLLMSAYRRAVAEEYRFYSYGDAMLVLP